MVDCPPSLCVGPELIGLLDSRLDLPTQLLAVIRGMGERVVPLAVQPSLQLLCRWQLVILWELQLLLLEQ